MKVVRFLDLRTGCLYPRKYSWYSFLLVAESNPGPSLYYIPLFIMQAH